MTPHPGEESLVSKILFIGILLVLLLILGACVFVIYSYMSPPGDPPTVTPAPTMVDSPTPSPTPTPTPQASVPPKSTPEPDTGYYQQDTKLADADSNFEFYYPGIWDRYVVYDMFDGMKNYTILYDTTTRQKRTIDSGTVFSYGTISNGKVMLYYPRNGNKIYLYDIKSGSNDLTSNDDNSARGSITMFDTKMAYYQDVGHHDTDGKWVPVYSIYVFDISMGDRSAVIDNIDKPLDIRIFGDKLVYTVVNGHGSDVYLLNLGAATSDRKPNKISTGTGNNNHARIYDHNIVYHSDSAGKDHVYVYDINTGKTLPISPNSEQWNADIYGSAVVYDDNRNGNWDIYAYDLNTHTERRITNEPHNQRAPVINGNRIAYMDDRDMYQTIYTMTI